MSNLTGVNDLISQMRAMQSQIKELQTPGSQSGVAGMNESARPTNESAFSAILKNSINKVNDAQMESNKLQAAFQNGDPKVQIAEVMLAMQKSNVSFQAMLQVRNKIIQAYQEIMNMPV